MVKELAEEVESPPSPYAVIIGRLKALNEELKSDIVTVVPADAELGLPEVVFISTRIESDAKELEAAHKRGVDVNPFRYGFIVVTEEGVILDRSPLMTNHMSTVITGDQTWRGILHPDPLAAEEAFSKEELVRHVGVYGQPDQLPRNYVRDGIPFVRRASSEEFARAVRLAKASALTEEVAYQVPVGTPEEYLHSI